MSTDKYIKNYIDGALVPAVSGNYLDNYNPSIGKVYSYIPDSDADDVQRAYEAAERAFDRGARDPRLLRAACVALHL